MFYMSQQINKGYKKIIKNYYLYNLFVNKYILIILYFVISARDNLINNGEISSL